jgi:predicted AlkP superfamily pyrophosphatase or phosphodiesterase
MIAAAALVIASIVAAQAPAAAAAGARPTLFDHVVVLSVDGLRPDAIDGPEDGALPGFRRMLRGPHTLQARTDPDTTITLPNHVSMLTSRPLGGPGGHGWSENNDPPAVRHGGTIHLRKGAYVAGMFDVAHDHGVATAVIATKSKFSLIAQSYDNSAGAPDATGADDGKAKVDHFVCTRTTAAAFRMAADQLRSGAPRTLTLLHIAETDATGHAHAWDMAGGSRYRAAVANVDAALDAFLKSLDAEPSLRGRVAILMTADHGGGAPPLSHTEPRAPVNFLIPFAIWLGQDGAPEELVALNADRRAVVPASEHVPLEAVPPPIRSAEAGNLALQLMGRPAIPGSSANAAQDLRLAPVPAARPVPVP